MEESETCICPSHILGFLGESASWVPSMKWDGCSEFLTLP